MSLPLPFGNSLSPADTETTWVDALVDDRQVSSTRRKSIETGKHQTAIADVRLDQRNMFGNKEHTNGFRALSVWPDMKQLLRREKLSLTTLAWVGKGTAVPGLLGCSDNGWRSPGLLSCSVASEMLGRIGRKSGLSGGLHWSGKGWWSPGLPGCPDREVKRLTQPTRG